MSMNEFDEQQNNESNEILPFAGLEQLVPSDFGEDDIIFAHELNEVFSPEQEELPPYFVQTLLASEDQLFRPVEPGFEHKTRARVFRRLKLRRRLFHTPRSAFDAFITGLNNIYARGSLFASVVAFTLIMLVTVAFTAPSFAAGVTILLHGARGGVYQVTTYPKSVHMFSNHHVSSHNNADTQPRQITLSAAQQQLHFRVYWPQSMPLNYSLDSIYLYHGAEQSWSDGPIIESVYSLTGAKSKGTGQIVIREFIPTEQVLPVVQDQAADPINVDKYGQAAAIYVNGQWVGRFKHTWSYGERSELIYQKNGVVFWIAGDQFDGIGKKALWKIAQSLQTIPFYHFLSIEGDRDMQYVTQTDVFNPIDPFTNDLLWTHLDGSSQSEYYISESAYLTKSNLPQMGTGIHGH